jgi:hypothetical protein
MDGRSTEDALALRAAFRADRDRIVGHALERLETVFVLAAVFVDRHGGGDYRNLRAKDDLDL